MAHDPILSRRLILEEAQRLPDGAGGYVTSWQMRGALWAALGLTSGQERAGANFPLSAVTYRITIRAAPPGAPSRPRPDMRLREGARIFRILAVAEADSRGRHLICFAREEVAG